MPRVEKTVFISYRRTNAPWALAISQSLTINGYDVFFDYTSIPSGDFEVSILENIRARAHFLVLLTPSALERREEPGDWFRREIEEALAQKRNIVPLMLEGFDFNTPKIAAQLTGTLASLKRYNAMTVSIEYFKAAMERLQYQFLSASVEAVLHSAPSPAARQAAREEQAAVSVAPKVTKEELTAQGYFERGNNSTNLDEKIHYYSEAIRLDSSLFNAFNGRGRAFHDQKKFDAAIADYNEAIRLKPDDARPFNYRGGARFFKGELDAAINDFSEAIRLNPDYVDAFNNRGYTRQVKGEPDAAISDCSEAIKLEPDYALAFINRGNARKDKGELDAAISDYNEAIRLNPDDALAFNNRGNARKAKGELDAAIADYDEAIRLSPGDASTFYNRAQAWRKKNEILKAIADFQRYLDLGGGERAGDTKKVRQLIRRLQFQALISSYFSTSP